jgi:RNase adaptor protein for sRNA GlmZ degradation
MSFEDYVKAAEYFENKYSVKKSINFIYRLRNKKRLIYIRTNILRKYNDQIRIHPLSKGDKTKPSMSVEKKEIFENNAKILIELLTEIKSDDFFLLAELNRNIGNFEEAKRILNQIPSSYKKDLLFQEINKKNCEVITVTQTSLKRQSDLNFI